MCTVILHLIHSSTLYPIHAMTHEAISQSPSYVCTDQHFLHTELMMGAFCHDNINVEMVHASDLNVCKARRNPCSVAVMNPKL